MINKLEYTFDDEPVCKFYYDIENKNIKVYFSAYSDLKANSYVEKPCVFIIGNWKEAKSKVGDEPKFYELNKHMGIFSLILYMKYEEDTLEMLVNTLDNRYITLVFTEPQLSLMEYPNQK